VGKTVGEDQRHGMLPQAFIGFKALSTGKEEREYRCMGTCRLFFTIDVLTNVVESWRYEGDDKDCAIPL
jgi:hypothetical protein